MVLEKQISASPIRQLPSVSLTEVSGVFASTNAALRSASAIMAFFTVQKPLLAACIPAWPLCVAWVRQLQCGDTAESIPMGLCFSPVV